MLKKTLWTLGLGLQLGLFTTQGYAVDAPKPGEATAQVSYYKQIRPILQLHCNGCHQPAKALGGYQTTSHADLFKTGDRGTPGIVVTDPDKSTLIDQIVPHGAKAPEMPKQREPLASKDVDLIKRWVKEGAKDDTPSNAKDPIDADHPPIYRLPPVVTAIDYSPDGSMIAVSGFHEILLHKADGGAILSRFVGVSERIQSLAFSPDGKFLAASGGSPGRFGEIQIWDIAKKKIRTSASFTGDTLYGVSWSPDGTIVAFGGADNNLRAINASTGKQVLFQGAHNDWVLGTAFGRDGKFLLSASRDRSLKLTEVGTQRFIDNVTSITPGALKGGLSALAVRPFPKDKDKKVKASSIAVGSTEEKLYEEVLIGGADGIPRVYKVHRDTKRVIGDDANKIREYAPLPGRIYTAAFRPDGAVFAVGSSLDGKGELRIFQTDDAKQLIQLDAGLTGIYTLVWKADGKELAISGFDGMVRIIDPATGKTIRQFLSVPISAQATAGR